MKKSLLPSPKEAKKVVKEDTGSSDANLVKTRCGCQGEIGEEQRTIPPSHDSFLYILCIEMGPSSMCTHATLFFVLSHTLDDGCEESSCSQKGSK